MEDLQPIFSMVSPKTGNGLELLEANDKRGITLWFISSLLYHLLLGGLGDAFRNERGCRGRLV